MSRSRQHPRISGTEKPKTQRIRDPVHDLIVFHEKDEFDQLVWRLLNTAEFQRLRRVRQLGLSEFVFPGATHTRFLHSVGVFHTARLLLEVLRRELGGKFKGDLARVSVCAALLHDLGHGPFSHTFEGVQKQRGHRKKHEAWTVDIVRGGTDVNRVLREYDKAKGTNLVDDVSALLKAKDPQTIYASIISSQFDADRLDYLRRDRYMTGTEIGGFDFKWLLDSLVVEDIYVSLAGRSEEAAKVPTLVLTEKGLQAAEGYLLARFHLYSQVYMHKTTRAAEKMLGALLKRVGVLYSEGAGARIGLGKTHPLARYLSGDPENLRSYLALDDTVVWSALHELAASDDSAIASLASRLRDRRLFKCFDATARAGRDGEQKLMRFRSRMADAAADGKLDTELTALVDQANITAYSWHEFDEAGALQKLLIRRHRGDREPVDIAKQSAIVASIGRQQVFRVYATDSETGRLLEKMWEE